MKQITFEIETRLDGIGEYEEFTWDLFPLINDSKTRHLDKNGLPAVGSEVNGGDILIGRIGKTENYDTSRLPNAIQVHGYSPAELRQAVGNMWYDASLYAPPDIKGKVIHATIDQDGLVRRARVVLEIDGK